MHEIIIERARCSLITFNNIITWIVSMLTSTCQIQRCINLSHPWVILPPRILSGRGGLSGCSFPDSTCKLLSIVFLRLRSHLELTLVPIFSVIDVNRIIHICELLAVTCSLFLSFTPSPVK